MGFFRTLLIGTLAIVGGCTVVVGGCTVGATKAGISAVDSIAETTTISHFNKLYADSPARAEKKYAEVTTECYEQMMRAKLGKSLPQAVITERVDFDIYEMGIRQSGKQENIKHLPAWRQQSEAKILASVADKTQRRQVKRYLKKVKKSGLLESMCIANGLAPKEDSTTRQASLRRR